MANDISPILIDSNVLIHAASARSEFHQAALDSLERLQSENASQWISTLAYVRER
jgi:predicted nucleic acid-binding protein